MDIALRRYPTITPINLTVTEGEVVDMKCTPHKERTDVGVEWIRDILDVSPQAKLKGGSFHVDAAQISDTGRYYCRHKTRQYASERTPTRLTVNPRKYNK